MLGAIDTRPSPLGAPVQREGDTYSRLSGRLSSAARLFRNDVASAGIDYELLDPVTSHRFMRDTRH